MYYVLLDVTCCPVETADLRFVQSPSLVTFWFCVEKLPTYLMVASLMVLDSEGNILKSAWDTYKKTVDAYTLDLIDSICIDGVSTDFSKYIDRSGMPNLGYDSFYDSVLIYERKLEMLPSINNILSTILK